MQKTLVCTHLPFITKAASIELSSHALLVEAAQLELIFNVNKLLTTRRRVRDVQLKEKT